MKSPESALCPPRVSDTWTFSWTLNAAGSVVGTCLPGWTTLKLGTLEKLSGQGWA